MRDIAYKLAFSIARLLVVSPPEPNDPQTADQTQMHSHHPDRTTLPSLGRTELQPAPLRRPRRRDEPSRRAP